MCESFSEAKNIKLCPSNLPLLHLETQTGSTLPFGAPQRGHAPSLSFPLVVKALEGIILSLSFLFLLPLVRIKLFPEPLRLDRRAALREVERGGVKVTRV